MYQKEFNINTSHVSNLPLFGTTLKCLFEYSQINILSSIESLCSLENTRCWDQGSSAIKCQGPANPRLLLKKFQHSEKN